MSVRSACCIGCCITLAILCMLVGINSLVRNNDNENEATETSSYSTPGRCRLLSISARIGRNRDGRCYVWSYTLDVGPFFPTDESALGMKEAFGNFYPGRCGGTFFNSSQINEDVPCWLKDRSSSNVRVSSLVEREPAYLTIGLVCICFAGVVFALFAVYNAVLWAGVCANVGPFSNASRREREMRARSNRESTVGSSQAPGSEPFEPATIPRADRHWLVDMALHNAYAKAVVNRFGVRTESGDELCEEGNDRPHELVAVASSEPLNEDHFHDSPIPNHNPATPDRGGAVVGSRLSPSSAPGGGNASDDVPAAAGCECCVCWEDVSQEAIIFPCFHLVCPGCVENLFHARLARSTGLVQCPMCRSSAFPSELRRYTNPPVESAGVPPETVDAEDAHPQPDQS